MAKQENKPQFLPGDGFMLHAKSRTVDLMKGAQNGWMTHPGEYDPNENYVREDIIPVLLNAPRGFNDLPSPELWIGALKVLIEEASKSIEGLNSTLTPEYGEVQFGGGGEIQHSITNMTRTPSEPTHVWDEKRGRFVQNFLEGWGTMLLMDPETKKPGVITLPGNENKDLDLSPSYRSATVIYIEPSADMKTVVNCWLCLNMMPKSFGDNTGKRDLNSAKELLEHSIAFTCISDNSRGSFDIAQKILDDLRLTGINPNNRKALLDGVSADVAAVKAGVLDRIAESANTTYQD